MQINDIELLDRFRRRWYGTVDILWDRFVRIIDPVSLIRQGETVIVAMQQYTWRAYTPVDLEYRPTNYGKITRSAVNNRQAYFRSINKRVF